MVALPRKGRSKAPVGPTATSLMVASTPFVRSTPIPRTSNVNVPWPLTTPLGCPSSVIMNRVTPAIVVPFDVDFIKQSLRWRSLVSVALLASRPRARLAAGLVVVGRPRWRSLVSVALLASRPRARLAAGLVVVGRPRWRSLVSVALLASRPRARLAAGLVVVGRPRWRSLVSVALLASRPRARLAAGLVVVGRPRWRSLVSVALRTSKRCRSTEDGRSQMHGRPPPRHPRRVLPSHSQLHS